MNPLPASPLESVQATAVILEGEYPLTGSQMWIWAGQQLHPDSPVYNMAFAFTISGPVDVAIFHQAFESLIAACDSLRTVVVDVAGAPRARVQSRMTGTLEFVDQAKVVGDAPAMEQWLLERAANPLRMEHRLFDSVLVKSAADRFVWYLNIHHLICDGWGYSLVYRHVADGYRRLQRGDRSVEWQLPSFWTSTVDPGPKESDQTPTSETAVNSADGRISMNRSLRERRCTLDLGIERSRNLRSFAQSESNRSLNDELSLLQVMLAIAFAFWHRVRGVRRLKVGVPIHQRENLAARNTIGMLQSVLAVEVEIGTDQTFAELLDQTRRGLWSAMRESHRNPSGAHRRPVFDFMVNFPKVEFPGFFDLPTAVRWLHPGLGDGHRLLFLHIQEFSAANSLVLHFDFNEGAFDAKLRDRATHEFRSLVDDLPANPHQRVASQQPGWSLGGPSIDAQTGVDDSDPLKSTPVTFDGRAAAGQASGDATGDAEQAVAEIWKRVLNVARIGRDERFFDLGGNSLQLMEVHRRLRERFACELKVTDLFRYPSVRTMAEHLVALSQESHGGR